ERAVSEPVESADMARLSKRARQRQRWGPDGGWGERRRHITEAEELCLSTEMETDDVLVRSGYDRFVTAHCQSANGSAGVDDPLRGRLAIPADRYGAAQPSDRQKLVHIDRGDRGDLVR